MLHLNFNGLQLLMILSAYFIQFCNCYACGPPEIPLNSKVQIYEADAGKFEAKYECDRGYEIFGNSKIKCDSSIGWDQNLPICATNVAFRKPVNQSSNTRSGLAYYANDGRTGNKNPDGQECSETQKEISPWWQVNLLMIQSVFVVRITTRGCCGQQPLQDLEIRVGNSSIDLQRNPLCAWYPGTINEGATKTFTCARPLVGQFVTIQLVGVEGSLSLCEVEVFSNNEISIDRCISPKSFDDSALLTFSNKCYEFHVKKGVNFEGARKICEATGGDLINNFQGATNDLITFELERRKTELKTQLVWIGALKEPGLASRVWKWIDGETVTNPVWGKDQPNNYNGEQNCVVFDGGRNWFWNDVGCNLDYLHFICQYSPLSCGSPDVKQNATVYGTNFSQGSEIQYKCPKGHLLVGNKVRTCYVNGTWSGKAPICKYIECGTLPEILHGSITLSDERTSYDAAAKYICKENYTLNGNENRTCKEHGWSGQQPECLLNWCPNPAQILNGKVEFSGNKVGSIATHQCNSGYMLIGEPILTCQFGGSWSHVAPFCRFVDCGQPKKPDKGYIILINGTTTVGSKAQYECDGDFWLDGPSEVYCNKEGRWSDEPPLCELITCDPPQIPSNSFVVGYDYNLHSKIVYDCDPGHVLRGNKTLECLENGEWSTEAPFCEYIDCGLVPSVPFGIYNYIKNTTYVNSEVLFSCFQHYNLHGNSKRLCQESGEWSGTPPKCEEIRCNEPLLPLHSFLSVTGNDRMYGRTHIRTAESNLNSVQTYKIGALAKYRCERGYKMFGEALVTCQDNGLWSGIVPKCIYVECNYPPKLTFGKVVLTTNITYYGATALYECEPNYKLNGVSRRLCLENGTWSHDQPSCDAISCDIPEVNENIIVEVDKYTVGSVARFKCSKGRHIIGNDFRICQENGKWTGKIPRCKVIDCGIPSTIENGRTIIVNDSTHYGGTVEYHCIPNYYRIGQYLRKCSEYGTWSGDDPKCVIAASIIHKNSTIGINIIISTCILLTAIILLSLFSLYHNKARPVKNTENIQAAEISDERSATVMSYSALETSSRMPSEIALPEFQNISNNAENFNIDSRTVTQSIENIYDQIPNDQFYNATYEMRTNEEVYEPEPREGNAITINGISVR